MAIPVAHYYSVLFCINTSSSNYSSGSLLISVYSLSCCCKLFLSIYIYWISSYNACITSFSTLFCSFNFFLSFLYLLINWSFFLDDSISISIFSSLLYISSSILSILFVLFFSSFLRFSIILSFCLLRYFSFNFISSL